MQFNTLTDNNTNDSIQNTDSNNNTVDRRTGIISLKITTSYFGDGRDCGGGGEDPNDTTTYRYHAHYSLCIILFHNLCFFLYFLHTLWL